MDAAIPEYDAAISEMDAATVIMEDAGCAPCALQNAEAVCVQSRCEIAACQIGYADCDGDSSNGCETDLSSDANCGRCGASCTAPKANQYGGCTNGLCLFPECIVGFADCDGNAQNGCETNARTDAKNCGGCGIMCITGKSCVDGSCVSG